jgi:hypothetical protein
LRISQTALDKLLRKSEYAPAMQPAENIIAKFAIDRDGMKISGEAKVSEITGAGTTAPYRWQYPREKGGTGGTIPQRYHRQLLDYARVNNIDLKAEDFLPVVDESLPDDTPAAAPSEAAE